MATGAQPSKQSLKEGWDSKQPLRPRVRVRTGETKATADRNQTELAKQVPRSGEHTPGMHRKPRALQRTIDTVYFSTAEPRARSVNSADELD